MSLVIVEKEYRTGYRTVILEHRMEPMNPVPYRLKFFVDLSNQQDAEALYNRLLRMSLRAPSKKTEKP